MYLVFGGEDFYAIGGGSDFLRSFEKLYDAKVFLNSVMGKTALHTDSDNYKHDDFGKRYSTAEIKWAHIFCTTRQKVVFTHNGESLPELKLIVCPKYYDEAKAVIGINDDWGHY